MVEAISSPVDCHTAFAMTILNLSLRAVQKTRRGNLLTMTTCQQMAARLKASRHDNLFLHLPRSSCHSRSLKRFSAKPKCEPATSHTCGVVEAISLPQKKAEENLPLKTKLTSFHQEVQNELVGVNTLGKHLELQGLHARNRNYGNAKSQHHHV